MAAPTTTGPTRVNGNSSASAGPEAKSFALFLTGVEDEFSSGLSSEGILSKLGERLRIQPGGHGDKYGHAEGDGLRVAHDRTRGFAGGFEPGMDDDAEVVVERGNDIKDRKDREHGMVRFDKRKENEVLAHEAGGGRNPGKRKHEDQEQDGGGGAAIIQAVQIFQFLANEALLAQNDEDGKGAGSHEDVGEQVERDPRFRGL